MAKSLVFHSEVVLGHKAPTGFPVTCPTIDLAATWDGASKDLSIVRPPGQTVSKIHQFEGPGTNGSEALALRWKPDGRFLAVGWSDGTVRLMALESNKAVHHIQVCQSDAAKISYIAWASCNISRHKTTASFDKISDGIFKESDLSESNDPVDLPRELTFLEIDTALPKISALPSASAGVGVDASVFTLRSGIEFLFQPPQKADYDKVNAMLVGTTDGFLQLSINDSFVIGSFQCPKTEGSEPCLLLRHASHPLVSTHLLLLGTEEKQPSAVHLVPMDLPFISSAPINMSLLASKLTTLQKLLRYLQQTQLHMSVEWNNTRELPTRFLRSVQGDLENMESGPRTVVAALFHTALTGHAHGPVREWLLDSLAERGHKRWDKAVVSGLEALRSLVHENFLPALDRCAIILSRLRGLACFYDIRDDIGFSVVEISRVTDIIASMSLVGHRILVMVMDELENFRAFSSWLRFQIDHLSAPSSAGEELSEKEALLDTSKVLMYIERYLTVSPMSIFFTETSEEDQQAEISQLDTSRSLLDEVDKQLRRHGSDQTAIKALPTVAFLVGYALSRSKVIFSGIAEAQKRSVRFGRMATLSIGRGIAHMQTMMQASDDKEASLYAVLASQDADEVTLYRSGIDVLNGISGNRPVESCAISLGSRRIIDIKFLGREFLVMLCDKGDGDPVILMTRVDTDELKFAPYQPGKHDEVPRTTMKGLREYTLPETSSLRPVGMEVHGACDAWGEMPARICLLDSKRTLLRAFTIPKDP